LHQILHLIGQDKCQQALKLWAHHRHVDLQACNNCHYEGLGIAKDDCRTCLESKLRTLSLYEHEPEPLNKVLQEAVQKLQAFQPGTT